MKPIESELFNMAETAHALKLSERQFLRVRRNPDFPAPVQLGGKYMYTRRQIESIVRNLEIQAGFTG